MNATQSTTDAPDEGDGRKERRALRWLLIAALLHGLGYLLILPPWMGEDEPWHVEYAHYIGRGYLPWGGQDISAADLEYVSASQAFVLRELGGITPEEVIATQETILGSMRAHHFWERVDWAGNGDAARSFDQVEPYMTATHQPPLYYLFVGQLLRFSAGDVLLEMWVLRGLSLLAYLAVVLGSYELARRVFDDPWIVLACAMLVAWWPMHARQAAVVNNDVLVKVFSVWSLVVAVQIAREGITRRRLLAGLALAGLAILTKSTGLAAFVPLGLACLWQVGRGTDLARRYKLAAGAALLLLMSAVPLAYFFSNNPAVPHTIGDFWNRIARSTSDGFFDKLQSTSIGAFNWESRHLPQAFGTALGWVLALAALGLLVTLLQRKPDVRRNLVLLCAAGALTQLALVFLRGTAVGRYLMPMIAAYALLVCAGLFAPLPAHWRPRAVALLALVLLVFDGLFLWSGLVWNQYGVWSS